MLDFTIKKGTNMKKLCSVKFYILICTFVMTGLLSACGGGGSTPNQGSDTPVVGTIDVIETLSHVPVATGENVHVSDAVEIDYSNASQGYVMLNYIGNHDAKIKLQLKGPDGRTYTYNLAIGEGYQVFPLTGGSGTYVVNVLHQASGDKYSTADSTEITAEIKDEFTTYLYPNQFVDYSEETLAVGKSRDMASQSTSSMNYIENVYYEVMNIIEYDEGLAELALQGTISGYIPDLDNVVSSGKGICFDYAALMVAMLRAQDIPSQLVIGYAGEVYHAWVNVYTEESGWIDGAIQFNGNEWSLLDPTFSDNTNDSKQTNEYMGDGTNYLEKYIY